MELSLKNKNKLSQALKKKNLIVFDLDGTLAATKSSMDREMCGLMGRLLSAKKVAVIGGGKYRQFQIQFLESLKCSHELYGALFLFPTTATSFYHYQNGWKNVYTHNLSKQEIVKIMKAFKEVFKETGYIHPKKVYGEVIENRGTQVTFSALGQDVVAMLGKKKGVALKEEWGRECVDVKLKLAKLLTRKLPDLEVHAAGFTSIDITKKGINKAYGLRQIQKYLKIPIKKMLFVGDAIFPGGNDYAALKTGVDYMKVKSPEETKKIIRAIVG